MHFLNKLRSQKLLSFTLILFTLSIGIVIGTLLSTGARAAKENAAAPDATPLVIPNPVELSTAFTQIAKQVEPSVVNIATSYTPRSANRSFGRRRQTPQDDQDQGDNGMDDFFRFFGSPFGNGVPQMPQRRGGAVGSGVVVDPAGYILTNNHVVDKADRIQVKFTDSASLYDAKLVGVDGPTDLAVIRVEGRKNFTPARIGNSDAVQVGDWAMAIGSPFGFQATVTAGIISAKDRNMDDSSMQFQRFLQTDAAINPGNSGGPLINMRGEVIGINTAIASQSGGYQGIGFALPVNTAAKVYNDIIKSGKVTRGSIGIRFTQSDTERARAELLANHVNDGVFIEYVAPGGPAEKAGVRDGDIIVAIGGKPIRDGNELIANVTATPVGTPLDTTIIRDGKRQNLRIVVGDLAQVFPDQFGPADQRGAGPQEGTAASLGMSIQNLNPQRRDTLGIKEKGGVEVVEIEPNSFAEDIRLQAGDILLSINHQPVNSTDDVMRIKSTLKPGEAVQMRILRRSGGRTSDWTPAYVAGILPANPR